MQSAWGLSRIGSSSASSDQKSRDTTPRKRPTFSTLSVLMVILCTPDESHVSHCTVSHTLRACVAVASSSLTFSLDFAGSQRMNEVGC